MVVIAIIFGAIGAVTGLCALYFSDRATKTAERSAGSAERSAHAALMANASALAPDVEVTLGGEVRERWKFIVANTTRRPMGVLPVVANQGEAYGSSIYLDLTVACATRLRINNNGERMSKVTIDATSVASENEIFGQLAAGSNPPLETRTPLPTNTFDLPAHSKMDLVVYAGRTVGDWTDKFMVQASEPYEVLIDISAGPDAATLHWRLTLTAAIFTTDGLSPTPLIAAAIPPERSLVELKRTIGTSG